ncbi:hypothetical protein EMGBS15_17710 [Filimonas sp.]|nr:hypothetical protein EMGBS15_17710 [Filimonas sp.]
MKYTLQALGFGGTGDCNYPNLVVDTVLVQGGTLASFNNGSYTIQWGSGNTGTVQIQFHNPGGVSSGGQPCDANITIHYQLLPNPIAAFTSSPNPACFNNPTNITFNSSGSVGAVSYFWDFGDGFTSTSPNPVHAYTNPGTYTVCLTVSNSAGDGSGTMGNGGGCPSCVGTVCHNVVISNLPGPDISCIATVCAGTSETYCTSASCSTYNWVVTGGVITSGLNTPCITVQWGNGNPQGNIHLDLPGCPGYCSQGTDITVPIVPLAATITGQTVVCIGSTNAYSLPALPGTTYSWSISGGQLINGNNTNTTQINTTWSNLGTYTITCIYYDTSLNCGGTGTLVVNVLPEMKITGPVKRCAGTNSTLHSAIVSPATNVNCNWTVTPAGAAVTGGNGTSFANFSWTLPGTYVVVATPVAANVVCSPVSYTVIVYPQPVLSAINGPDSICANGTAVYSATSNMSGLFNWTIVGGTASPLSPNNDSVQIAWNPTGPYTISVSQSSYANNCLSNTLTKTVYAYPNPVLTGATNVCADNIETYTITNIGGSSFNWSVSPAQFGTVIGVTGSSVQIKWHGNNNPGGSNTVYLHYGKCQDDSIAITINEPIAPVITASGSLCSGPGITLTSSGTGTFSWSHIELPPYSSATNTLGNINDPGHYTVQIQNYNGSGCTVSATYNIPNVGMPTAVIYAAGPTVYCDSTPINTVLNALTGGGYTYQWYQGITLIPGATNSTYALNNGNIPWGINTYTFKCVVMLNGCSVTSNILPFSIVPCANVILIPCSSPAAFSITSITGCNPFTVTTALVSGVYIIPGTTTITHLEDGYITSGNTTRTYSSIGQKMIRICVSIKLPDSTVCIVCKDTFVLVNLAAKFMKNVNCGVITLTDQSTIFAPAAITGYNWSVTPSGSFNNNTMSSPVLTVTTTGTYIITQTVTSSTGCISSFMDTVNITLPDADFNVNPISCVGTAVNLNNLFPAPINYWNFGDATSSGTSPTFHAYAAIGPYNITHTVTDAFGCKDTVTKSITIIAAPTCTISYIGSTTFCFGDSLKLNACPGYTNYQWKNNGVTISGATSMIYYATQTGNYSFTATNPFGCDVQSDTVSITTLQSPSTVMTFTGKKCFGEVYSVTVPTCASCIYQWEINGSLVQTGTSNTYSETVGNAPFLLGTHLIKVTIFGSNGCSSSDSVIVTFNPQPTLTVSVVGNPPMLCSNNLYTFTAATNAASPAWAWTYSNFNNILSSTFSLTASSAGMYHVLVTDGITGCTNSATQMINESPDLTLFPAGCDTLCNNESIFLPLASFNGNVAGYTITWYDNAPPYTNIVGTGVSLNLNSLSLGNHNLSVIVVGPNGCIDTSNVYYIYIVSSTSSNITASACGSYTWSVNGVTYTTSGTYTSSTINNAGCPQYDTLNLTITTSSVNTSVVTVCDSYTWALNGVTYTASGSYTVMTTLPNGCIHLEKLILTIYHSTETVINATACGSYTWTVNGVTYTSSGTYTVTSLNPHGCTHTKILNLVISTGSSTTTTATACGPYTWVVNGVTYTASGTYTNTYLTTDGCLHTDSLLLMINAATGSSQTVTACNSFTWVLNGATYTVSGTYTHLVIDPTGCDHVDTLILVINHNTDVVSNAVACGSYTWAANGVTYTASGTYSFTSVNAGGCVQYNILQLTITTGVSISTNITACGSYIWPVNGVTYTASGTYTYTSMSANGCINTNTLILTINQNTSSLQTIFSCDMYTWPLTGITYTASGTYTHTNINANGCVHTSTLVLTIGNTTVTTAYIIACGSYTWTVNGVTYTASGSYTVVVYSGTACPHIYLLCLTILPNTATSTSVTACNSYTWPANGVTYTNSGVYSFTTLNANGCTNTSTLNLTILPTTTSAVSATACNSYTWPLNGVTYTASGTYTFTTTNAQGCPHITTLNLTITTGSTTHVNVIACDSYTWFGVTYTASGTYTRTNLNANGCVQTTILHLTINTTTVITSYVTACGPYLWTVNGVTYTLSGTYTVMTIGPNGCPRLYVLCLTVNQPTSSVSNINACNQYLWPVNGVTYTASGTYTYTSLNANGCVNTATLNLTINQSTNSTVVATACNSYLWAANGLTYTVSGSYTYTVQNTQGCPHTYTLLLTIRYGVGSTSTVTACNSYTWAVNGATYTASGVYTVTTMNANGCINTSTLNLTIQNTTSSSSSISACNSYTWPLNGVTYTASGTYTYTYTNTAGCAHIATLNLTIHEGTNVTTTAIACDMYIWPVNGQPYTQSGTYTYTSVNAYGCIDTATLILTMGATTVTHLCDSACCSYTWAVNGVTYTESGTYSYIVTGPDGCPHIYILCITILPCTSSATTVIACGSYTWSLNGITYTQSGTYTATTLNAFGCPITDTLILTVGSGGVVTTSTCDTICGSFTWPVNGVTYTLSGVYTYIVNDANGCPHIYILCITILHHTESVTNVTATNFYTWNTNGVTYLSSGSYTATITNSMGCDSILTLNLNIISIPSVGLSTKVLLNGPYQPGSGLMYDSLRQQGLIPLTEPYSGAPYYKQQLLGGGGESTSPAVLNVTGNNAIVDWVHIEIRSASNSSQLIATKNALLQRDGDIVSSSDGISPLSFPLLPAGNYFVSIKHRNHLGVMTAMPISMNLGTQTVDFTTIPLHTVASIVNNTPANVVGGIKVLWSGDPNYNKNVKYNGALNDKDPILMSVGLSSPNNTVYGYRLEDLNMDGKVRYNNLDNDRNIILNNVGAGTPNKVLSQHTPN